MVSPENGKDQVKRRENEPYPPITTYEWHSFKNLLPAVREFVTSYLSQNAPDNEPRDVLVIKGHPEEATLTGIVLKYTTQLLMEQNSFPKVHRVINEMLTREMSPVGFLPAGLQFERGIYSTIIFERYGNVPERDYKVARRMIIDSANINLSSMNRQPIPLMVK